MSDRNPQTISISSLGMISSVGQNVGQACASIRAGLSRPREITYFEALNTDNEPVPLMGHPIRACSEGFNQVGLWIRLGQKAVRDLIHQGNLPGKDGTSFWPKTALIAVTPYINDERFLCEGTETPDLLEPVYLDPLHQALGLPLARSNMHLVCLSHAGTIKAIQTAQKLLVGSALERVLILAVDSYLDSLTLDWLAGHGRLKTGNNAVGLTPGEAGACFLLETQAAAHQRNAPVYALVEGTGFAREANHLFSGKVNRGAGLSAAIGEALASRPFFGDVVIDLNGENWRAHEFSCARILLGHRIGDDVPLLLPCLSTGELGAASGAVSVCVAVRAFIDNYATGDRTLVVSSSEYGDTGALCLIQST